MWFLWPSGGRANALRRNSEIERGPGPVGSQRAPAHHPRQRQTGPIAEGQPEISGGLSKLRRDACQLTIERYELCARHPMTTTPSRCHPASPAMPQTPAAAGRSGQRCRRAVP